MGDSVIFLGWNRAVPGRERASGELFTESLQYLGGLQQAGGIDSFEPVLLTAHGGDLNGFIMIRGDSGQLNAMVASDEWRALVTRGGLLLEGLGVVRGVAGELLMQSMARWTENIPD